MFIKNIIRKWMW